MNRVFTPEGYRPPLSTYDLQRAIEFIKQDFQQKKYLRHRVITERFSVREDAIQRLMTQKNYSERWMPGEGTV